MDTNETTANRHLSFQENFELLDAMMRALSGDFGNDNLRHSRPNSSRRIQNKTGNDPLHKYADTRLPSGNKKGPLPTAASNDPKAQ